MADAGFNPLNHKYLFCFLTGIMLANGIAALTLEDVVSADIARELKQKGKISREYYDSASLNLLPRYPRLVNLLEPKRRNLAPTFTVETLCLYQKPSANNWTGAEQVDLFNGITALSTLKGVQYYSKSRDKMRVLYDDAKVIDGPATKKVKPDPVYSSLPAQADLYTRLKDSTFGDNVYKFTFYTNESAFLVFQENVTNITYGVLPLVDKNNLQGVIAVIDCGQYLLVYASTYAKASMLPGMKQRVAESVGNKFAATLSWFMTKADKAFTKKAG
jgi:hypothetical protein